MPSHQSHNASSGRESTFGRGLVNYISSKMPYQNNSLIDNIGQLNPKFKFKKRQPQNKNNDTTHTHTNPLFHFYCGDEK